MNNAVYIALAQQTNLFRNMDVVANNVANVNTPGFKGETTVFQQYLVDDKDEFRNQKIAFSHDVATVTDYKDGAATPTGRSLDVALEGEGFMKVETAQGTRYTRRGNFRTNEQGELTTAEGYPVLDSSGGHIRLQQDDIDFVISGDGTIKASISGEIGEKQVRGKIDMVTFANPQKLQHLGEGLYNTTQQEIKNPPARMIQGSLEQSNVNSITELTSLININRSTAGVTSLMSDLHDLTRRAITAYTRSV